MIDRRTKELLDLAADKPTIAKLGITMALEHYTAMMAHEFLANPQHFKDSDPEVRKMWEWHAVEEIEHKGVAYDVWNHATRDWSGFQRWLRRSIIMLEVTRRFLNNRWVDATELLAQDGITGWRAHWGLAKYLFGKPGVLRRIFPSWLSYFKPGFHPWNHDDRALIGKYEGDYQDALLPA